MAQASKVNIKKRPIIIAGIILILLLDIFITGFMKFGYNVVRCGRLPVQLDSSSFAAASAVYKLPGHYIPGGQYSYVCTENEAKAKGYVKFLY